jgi:lysophospholipase L1-like esterase
MAMRARVLWCALLFGLGAASGARAADPPYYLALGDSLAVGIQPAANGELVPTNEGYVDDLYAFYRTRHPTLRLAKLGCSGETTASMITGIESPCSYDAGSQLLQAVAFLRTHRVVLITLDIGGDNLLQCLSLTAPIDSSCVTNAAATAANDLAAILGTLRVAAPHALIVGMDYYDPLLAASILGPGGQALATASLAATRLFNHTLLSIYQALQVPVADVAATFRIESFPVNVALALTWTWMGASPPRGPDVHPNAVGYLAIASAFAKAIAGP